MSIWRLKGARGNTDQGMCPIYTKQKGWNRMLRCEGTRSWKNESVDERFTSTNPESGIRRIVAGKDEDKWQKIGL
jgi:hypothetical protein